MILKCVWFLIFLFVCNNSCIRSLAAQSLRIAGLNNDDVSNEAAAAAADDDDSNER